MINIDFISYKNNLKNLYNFLKSNIDFYKNFSKDKKLHKKLNKISEQKFKFKNKAKFIVDGHFFNFGYFFRLQLLRAATESYKGDELGLISNYNQQRCKNFLKNTGISSIRKIPSFVPSDTLFEANKIYKKIKKSEDILEIRFPHNTPSKQFYDYVLKKQMLASVNIEDENIPYYIAEYIESIRFAEKLIEDNNPQKIFMSHGISIQCTPLCWLASKKNIDVFTLFGNFGVPRFLRFNNQKDINLGFDTASKNDLEKLNNNQINLLHEVGKKYINKRLLGKTNDVGGQWAYDNELKDMNDFIKNKNGKPVIVIYTHCWFDCPHAFGMDRFRDFEDWVLTTYKSILENTNFIWLFRAHPGEDWYGGITLKDILPKDLPDHIFILPKQLSGKSVMKIASGLITYHGTSAIEYASCGKPVIVADKGWYHQADFVIYPKSRSDYVNLLSKNWFLDIDQEKIKRNAKIFAGLYFCCPTWQKRLIMPHDINQKEIKDIILDSLESKSDIISYEIQNIKKWIDSNALGYHIFNMLNANEYSLSNTI
tara:strand:+ start:1424 stop:3040 length:1617 start_codon:yes stop_codon:yes gene_type:complete